VKNTFPGCRIAISSRGPVQRLKVKAENYRRLAQKCGSCSVLKPQDDGYFSEAFLGLSESWQDYEAFQAIMVIIIILQAQVESAFRPSASLV